MSDKQREARLALLSDILEDLDERIAEGEAADLDRTDPHGHAACVWAKKQIGALLLEAHAEKHKPK